MILINLILIKKSEYEQLCIKGTGKPFFDLFDLMNKQVWHLQLILPLFVVDWGCPEIL